MKHIVFEDTTLRDGEQAPGVAFSLASKMLIYSSLIDTGVKWLEIGIPAMGGDELKAIEAILERKNEAKLVGWNRGIETDVLQSIKLGFEAVHIGLPTSNLHLSESLNKNRDWLVKRAVDLIKRAKDHGVYVSISAEDVGRTEMAFVEDYAGQVAAAGADRLRLSDTVGILTPAEYGNIVRRVKTVSAIPIQCHAHNDFGLATANTLAGLEAGATFFHATVNGVGERAGMPDIAQCALALKVLYGIDLGLDLKKLRPLSNLVADKTRTRCPPWQPIVGHNVFRHESGIHANGTLKNRSTFEPFPPELVGAETEIVLGKHSGKASIKHVANSLGFALDETELTTYLDKVRSIAMKTEKGVAPEQLFEICKQTVNRDF